MLPFESVTFSAYRTTPVLKIEPFIVEVEAEFNAIEK